MKKEVNGIKELREEFENLMEKLNNKFNSLYNLATRDEKTGLYNHKFFSEIFNIEFEKAKRGSKLSLSILDLDYFKKINSRYGHIEADRILKNVAKLIKNSVRKSDIVARFGGEEFIILFLDTPLKKAEKIVKRINKNIKEKFKRYNLTISGGMAEYKKGDTKNSMKKRADKALYSAKKTRDNVMSIS